MADGVSITIVGDKHLVAKLDRIRRKDARAAIRKGTRTAAKILLPAVKGRAPKGETSSLQKAIRVRASKRSRKFIGAVVASRADWLKAGGKDFYLAFQEWGWHAGKRKASSRKAQAVQRAFVGKSFGKRRWIEGKHFLEKAAEISGQAAGRSGALIIRDAIEAAARRG